MKNIINKSEIYYVYIASKNKSCYIGNKENLIYYLSKGYRQSYWDNRDENIYFRDINASGKDSYVSYLERKEYKYDEFDELVPYIIKEPINVLKEYTFYDGLNRIIDVRIFKKEVENYYKKSMETKKNWYEIKRKDNYETGEEYIVKSYYGNCKQCYRFRRGPVPHIHKPRSYKFYRRPQMGHLRRDKNNPEISKYIRPKRRNVETSGWYDDYYRSDNQKNWKKQCKCRHQWEKNLK